MKKNNRTCLIGCASAIVVMIGMVVLFGMGQQMHEDFSQTSMLLIVGVVLVAVAAYGLSLNKKHPEEIEAYRVRNKQLNAIAKKYNTEINNLQKEYDSHNAAGLVSRRETGIMRLAYEKKYNSSKKSFEQERDAYLASWEQGNHTSHLKNFWQWALGGGIAVILLSQSMSCGADMGPIQESPLALMESRTWSAANIPMPHMMDHSQYVSNPDSILSQQTVDSINITLGQLDDILGIESAMVIVGHIEDDDPVAMVRGIYDKYKVGRNDRGLVIVVGYLDHSYFIAPGRSLEGDLTDMECNHLAQDYLIPSMRAEQPDSGMLYLARGVYSLMTNKEMPQMSSLAGANSEEESVFGYPMLYMVLLIAWLFFGFKMRNKVGWATTAGVMPLMTNPFFISSGGGGGGFHSSGGGGRSWGGGGGHSGGYGGGSWGGGGSGGRW